MDRPKSSPLTRSQWTRKETVISNTTISEVDMADAGMSVIRLHKLLPAALIKNLERLPKHERSVQVGKLARSKEYRGLAKTITSHIKESVLLMCDANNIEDKNIIAVKRDAVFIKGRPPKILSFKGGLVNFKIKNIYSDFMYFNGIEFYFNQNRNFLHIKGIADREKDLHSEYLIVLFKDILQLDKQNKKTLILDTLTQFRIDYVNKELPLGFYRELNSTSGFPLEMGRVKYIFNSIKEDKFSLVNIQYNIVNVIIPLFKHYLEN